MHRRFSEEWIFSFEGEIGVYRYIRLKNNISELSWREGQGLNYGLNWIKGREGGRIVSSHRLASMRQLEKETRENNLGQRVDFYENWWKGGGHCWIIEKGDETSRVTCRGESRGVSNLQIRSGLPLHFRAHHFERANVWFAKKIFTQGIVYRERRIIYY